LKVSITNHTGARNRGCEALVLSKIIGISKQLEGAKFSLHSNDPTYDAWRFSGLADAYWSYLINTPNHANNLTLNSIAYSVSGLLERAIPKVKGVNAASIKEIRNSDLVVASGGDIFTSDYGNLRKHLSYPLVAGKSKSKVYLCSHSIGPFKPKDESYFLKAATSIDMISAREQETYDYLKSIDIQTEVRLTADVAFTLPSLKKLDAQDFLKSRYNLHDCENLVALSISQGIIKYSGLDHDTYYATFAQLCDALIDLGKKLILVPHVMEKNPDNNDIIACDEVIKRMKRRGDLVVLSGEPSATQLKGVIGCCECLIGTRTHATIAAMSQGVPTVSIAYSRKAYGIMKDVYGLELGPKLTVSAKDITLQKLMDAYILATKSHIDESKLQEIKSRAEENFSIARELMY
tara:strand:+ start:9622 stop:10839 length:1218 start_codon:yes stop_codon:yes gene_type:complete